MKAYIAGPMTGFPGENISEFDKARDQLIVEGYNVVSPPDISRKFVGIADLPAEQRYAFYIREDLRQLIDCQIMFVLDKYEESKGVALELHVAQMINIPVLSYSTRKRILSVDEQLRAQQQGLNQQLGNIAPHNTGSLGLGGAAIPFPFAQARGFPQDR